LWCILLVGSGLVASASGEQGVRWQVSLDTAKRLAAQTNRLVLIHFWADWCQPCRTMEQEVFTRQEVASAIESGFVPVKVNVDHFPHTREQFGVTVLPSDVIITPDGQLVRRMGGAADADQYVARLSQIAGLPNRPGVSGPQVAVPAGLPLSRGGPHPPAYDPRVSRPPEDQASVRGAAPDHRQIGRLDRRQEAEQSLVGPRYAGSAGPVVGVPPRGVPSVTIPPADDASVNGPPSVPAFTQPNPAPGQAPAGLASHDPRPQVQGPASSPPRTPAAAPTIQLPPGNPPLGLDGYCPVELTEKKRWVQGNTRWGLIHRGRTYLFAGPEQRDRFDADPDRYAPMASGNDVVLFVERGELTRGRREHGGWFEDRVYLFSSQDTYMQFYAAPEHYVRRLVEISQQPNMAQRDYGRPDGRHPAGGPVPQDLSRRWQ
jgi:protein disulfide-isomerase